MKPVLPDYTFMFSPSLWDICSSIIYLQMVYYVPGSASDDGNSKGKSLRTSEEERSTDYDAVW